MSKRTHNLFQFLLDNLDAKYYDIIEYEKERDEIKSIHLSSVGELVTITLTDYESFIMVTRYGFGWSKDYELLNVNFSYYSHKIILLMRDDFDYRLELRMR